MANDVYYLVASFVLVTAAVIVAIREERKRKRRPTNQMTRNKHTSCGSVVLRS
jgi:hypothetical protein